MSTLTVWKLQSAEGVEGVEATPDPLPFVPLPPCASGPLRNSEQTERP